MRSTPATTHDHPITCVTREQHRLRSRSPEQNSAPLRISYQMEHFYTGPWVQTQVEQTIALWNTSASAWVKAGPRYTVQQQQQREQAYDEGLQAVEKAVRRSSSSKLERLKLQDQITALFARFSATVLDLQEETIQILTDDFIPVGTQLARWARHFDPSLSMADIIQASRNAWTACGLQPLLGMPVRLTPSILGYSLLYPYSDNYLDEKELSAEAKLRFSARFRSLLQGENPPHLDQRESVLQALIALIETQYPRAHHPQVFDSLLAIHQAQEHSITQLTASRHGAASGLDLLRVSCAKGGTSVLADACLAYGHLTEQEMRFAFEWGVLLQLGDDLQDIRDDRQRGSSTLFSCAAASGKPLDELAIQLLNFSEHVGARMDRLPNGSSTLKELLKMSWRSLIIRAVAESHTLFSHPFLREAERYSPFRFHFLRERNDRLASRQGLYAMLFEAFLEQREQEHSPYLPSPNDLHVPTPTRPSSITAS